MTPAELFTKQYMEALKIEGKKAEKEIENAYMEAVAVLIALYLPRSKTTSFTFPKSADLVFTELRGKLDSIFTKYSENAALLSKDKNLRILNRPIADPDLSSFFTRKIQGHTRKTRILKYTEMFKMEVEARIAIGIAEGQSQLTITRDIQKFLDNPYDNLIVSKRADWKARRLAVKYNTGTGTYKSSFANARRLVRSEIFETFRRADFLTWSRAKEVTGILVYENPAHPKKDTCDDLWGAYPKNYYFPGFHGACICLSRPIIRGENIKNAPENFFTFLGKLKKDSSVWGLPFINKNKKYWK